MYLLTHREGFVCAATQTCGSHTPESCGRCCQGLDEAARCGWAFSLNVLHKPDEPRLKASCKDVSQRARKGRRRRDLTGDIDQASPKILLTGCLEDARKPAAPARVGPVCQAREQRQPDSQILKHRCGRITSDGIDDGPSVPERVQTEPQQVAAVGRRRPISNQRASCRSDEYLGRGIAGGHDAVTVPVLVQGKG